MFYWKEKQLIAGVIDFLLNDIILSSHMKQLSQHINSTNHQICSSDNIVHMIVDLFHMKGARNYDSSTKLTGEHNTFLMRNFDIPENYLSHYEESHYK